jgi:hypothetical protein
MKKIVFLAAVVCGLTASRAAAQVTVYDNLGTAATAGYSEVNTGNPTYGDSLNMTQGGTLATVGFSIFNSSSGGNTGSILTGTEVINFYDNTVPYAGGPITNPLLGTITLALNFGTGLPVGFFTTFTSPDESGLNINLTPNVLITQNFTQLTGTSLRNGVVLFSNPTTGTSPNTVYISSTGTPANLYTFTGNPGQFGYTVTVAVPEPTSLALVGLVGAAGFGWRRWRNK